MKTFSERISLASITKFAKDFLLLVTAILFVGLTSNQHFKESKEFYFWDNAGYHDITLQVFDSLSSQSVIDTIRDLYHSFSGEISNLFSFPLLPLIYLLGESRKIFILSLAVIYLLPSVLLASWVIARICGLRNRSSFWIVTFMMLLSPFCWVSILDGRPDIGCAGIVLLAAALIFKTEGFTESRLCYLLSGLLIAVSFLFRRHFMLMAPAFLVSMVLSRIKVRNILCWLLGLLVGLGTVGRPFLTRYFDPDLKSVYASYEVAEGVGRLVTAKHFITFYGLIWWFCVVWAVWIWSSRLHGKFKIGKGVQFLWSLAIIWIGVWTVFGIRARHNYLVSIYWLFPLAIAVIAQGYQKKNSGDSRGFLPKLFFVVFILVGGASLFGFQSFGSIFFPEEVVHHKRKDFDEIKKLVSDLKKALPKNKKILVAGSSGILNESILMNAESQMVGRKKRNLNIIGILHADSYKHIPIKEIVEADLVIVPTPFQWHMRPDVQQCVQVLHDAFKKDWKISKDFKKLLLGYNLSGGVSVELFQRIRPTSEGVVSETEKMMRQRILK